MEMVLQNASVQRVLQTLLKLGADAPITTLSESARSAAEAAAALGIEVGQVASSIVFRLPDDTALLVITSGRHRVDAELVAKNLGVDKLRRADADFVRISSGFAIGGVSPVGWSQPATVLIDEALNDYEVIWAAAGHPHAVFPTTYEELVRTTKAEPMIVAKD